MIIVLYCCKSAALCVFALLVTDSHVMETLVESLNGAEIVKETREQNER